MKKQVLYQYCLLLNANDSLLNAQYYVNDNTDFSASSCYFKNKMKS